MTTDWGALYREHVADVSALAGDLTEAELDTMVPGTPAWTVHEVYAHLAGAPSDAVTGRMDGAPAPEWTSRHVSERRLLPIADLVEELQSHQDAVVESIADNPSPALVWNLAVHHADLHEALGKHRMDEHLWLPIVEELAPQRAAGLAEAGVAPYELFRALFSRRSRAQMRAWGTGLDGAALDAVCVFGPREDDQPVPA
jgi:hypothetical protein